MFQAKSLFLAVMTCLTFSPPIIAQFDIILSAWKDNKKISERHDGVNICTIGSDVRTLEIRVSIAPTPDFPLQEYGPFQWQLSIEVGGDAQIIDFNSCTNDIAGLLGEYCDCCDCGSRGCGTERAAFLRAYIAHKEDNNGRYGIVSAAVLSITAPITLNPTREQEVLIFGLEIPTTEEEIISTIQFINGLHSGRRDGSINFFGVYTNYFKEFENEIGLIIAKSISPPSEISAQLRTPQSAGISWVDNAQNETSFVLERKLVDLGVQGEGGGGAEDWTQISEVPVNTTMYIDPVLPPNNEATYRIAAKNANGTSSKVLSEPITTPDSRWQLKIYDSATGKWVDLKKSSQFNPDWGTAVIVHGWNVLKENQINGWIKNIATLIKNRISEQNVNLITWDWLDEAMGPLADVLERIDAQIYSCSSKIREVLALDYKKPIHIMGHSLGCLFAADMAILLGQRSNTNEKSFRIDQVTLWDPPDSFYDVVNVIHDIDDDIRKLRSHEVYIDLYHGITNRGTHNANLWVDVPGATHGVDEWYSTTIPSSYTQTVLDERGCGSPHLPQGLGFGNSVLLPEGERARIPEVGCGEQGTLMFSKLCRCSDLTRLCQDEIYGLMEKRGCVASQSPTQRTTRPNRISVKTQRTEQGAGAQAEDIVAQYSEELFIDPEWDYINIEYDFISAPSPADLEIAFIQSESTYPIFTINSEAVFNEEFQEIGLRRISGFHGQNVTLLILLRSSAPDAEVVIQNMSFWQDPFNTNNPPQAHAGLDQTLKIQCNGVAQVTLDGSLSTDPV